jgi:hypothetical protein
MNIIARQNLEIVKGTKKKEEERNDEGWKGDRSKRRRREKVKGRR